jgi:uncharacterized protein (DUF1800 family)
MGFLDAYTVPLDERFVRHLLRRTTFSPTLARITQLRGKTAAEIVDILLDEPSSWRAPAPPIDPTAPQAASWTAGAYNASRDADYFRYLRSWWTGLMVAEGLSLRETMTLFWHNHFVSSYSGVMDARYLYKQNALLRRLAFGNVRQLVKEITIDPAMLRYLNGNTNTNTAINENYGRELQELFAIGKGQEIAPGNYTFYTEQDVRAAARVLTGWTDDAATVSSAFFPDRHDSSDKQFSSAYQNTIIRGKSGRAGAEETDELLDMIFRQDETALFFCRKLYRWFVNTEISASVEREVIVPLANTLRSNAFSIKPVLRQLLTSQHFFDEANIGSLVKHPLAVVVSTVNHFMPFMRPALPTLAQDPLGYYNAMEFLWTAADQQEMGIMNHPNVAGWKAYYQTPLYDQLWITTSTLAARYSFTDKLFNGFTLATKPNGISTETRFAVDSIAYAQAVCANPGNGDDLVDKASVHLSATALTSQQKLYLMDEVLAPGFFNARGAWDMNWSFYVAAPNDAGKRQAVQSRIDAVLKFVMQMPEFHLM